MNCPSCQQQNPAEARYCMHCGRALERACASCAAPLAAEARFCASCGEPVAGAPPARDPRSYTPKHLVEKVLHSRSVLEGERKRVTVLFADVKGSMELAEQVDPEEWHAILDRFFEILADGVHRFEGTVNQYTGDGIMALFGAPIAHEDHAQRACYAALHLQEALREYARELRRERGLDFNVRVGINSGEVVVGKIGDDLRMDYTAQGPTVGLAARIQQRAEPGRAWVTDNTAALVSGYFDLEDLGEFKLKGSTAPVRVHALQGVGSVRTRLDVSRQRGFSRFVGRAVELVELEGALERARVGEAGVYGVVAEAGAGKSRLCAEFARRCRAAGTPVFEAYGVSHGKNLPLLPVVQLLRAIFGVSDGDSDRAAREKIAGRLLLLDDAFRDTLPLAFDLLGVPDPQRPPPQTGPEGRQHQVAQFLRRLLQTAGESDPAVFMLEDLHWIDAASHEFLMQMVEALAGTRIMVLLNFRPEYRAVWMARPFYRQIELAPLGPEEIRALARDLLGSHPSVAALPELIGAQTGGNPFFVEETVRALAESGRLEGERGAYRLGEPLLELGVPDSVQAILAARIDRLGEREKHVLQTAAVIGKQFRAGVLANVGELPDDDLASALSALCDGEFVYEEALYPEAEYAFRHPLTQEVAYDSQLRDRRARLHAEVARTMEALAGEGNDEDAPLIAHHWERAGEPLAAARWCARAAQRVGGSNPGAARDYWRRVVGLLEEEPEAGEVGDLLLEACKNILILSFLAGISSDETTSVYFRARMLAEERDDTASLAFIAAMYGLLIASSTGDLRASLRHSQEAWDLGVQTGDRFLLLMIGLTLISALQLVGRVREAQQICQAVLEGGPDDPALAELYKETIFFTHARAEQARLIGELGDPREAAARLERVLPEVRSRGGLLLEGIVHQWRALMLCDLGEADAIMEEARASLALAERVGAPYLEAQALFILGLAHETRAAWAESAESFERSIKVTEQSRTGTFDQPYALAHLAIAQAGLGDLERARATAAGALERARQIGCRSEWPWYALARVGILAGDAPEEVEQALQALEAEMEGRENPVRIAATRVIQADLAARRADTETERLRLEEAERLFDRCGATKRARAVAERLTALGAA